MKKVLMIGPSRKMKGGVSTVVNSYYQNNLDKYLELYYLETRVENSIYSIFKFLKSIIYIILNSNRYDIIHVHMASRGSFLRKSILIILCKIQNRKIVIHLHGAEFMKFYNIESGIIMKRYIRLVLGFANRIIALSSDWKRQLETIVESQKIEVITNAVSIPNVDNFKSYDNRKILFLGRIGERKGIYDLVEISTSIIEKYPDVEFIVGGDGEIDKLKILCEEMNVQNKFRIIGWADEETKIRLLKEATLYVLPSYNEGMPMSILEAMSFSLPIISTNVGGIPELVTDNENGFIFNPGDKKKLLENILTLLDNDKIRFDYGRKSREKVVSSFSIDNCIENLIDLYNTL